MPFEGHDRSTQSGRERAFLILATAVLAAVGVAVVFIAQPGDAQEASELAHDGAEDRALEERALDERVGETSAVETAYRRAAALDREGDPAAALAAWRDVIAEAPGSRMASRAQRRVDWLEARSEDDFRPLTALLRFRASDDPDRAAFASEVEAMPEGRVRVEARLSLAQAFARAGDTDRAAATYRAVIAEPRVLEDESRLARDELAGALAAGGDLGAALDELEGAGMSDSARHGVLLRAARRTFLEPMAWAAIALFVVLVLAGIQRVRGVGRALAALGDPATLAAVAIVAIGPYLIARATGDEATFAFAVLGAANALGLLLAFAARAAFPSAPSPARRALSVTAVLAALGAGYLAALYHAQSLPFA